jgi:hypothetical protein
MKTVTLKRFKDKSAYSEHVSEGKLKDGDFFIISDTKQFGANCKGNYILTPSNTLNNYVLPSGEIPVNGYDTISSAIAKLEYRVNAAKNLAQTAINVVPALENLENVSDADAALMLEITALRTELSNLPRHLAITEDAYNELESIDPNTIYYIYTDD